MEIFKELLPLLAVATIGGNAGCATKATEVDPCACATAWAQEQIEDPEAINPDLAVFQTPQTQAVLADAGRGSNKPKLVASLNVSDEDGKAVTNIADVVTDDIVFAAFRGNDVYDISNKTLYPVEKSLGLDGEVADEFEDSIMSNRVFIDFQLENTTPDSVETYTLIALDPSCESAYPTVPGGNNPYTNFRVATNGKGDVLWVQ